MTPLLRRDARSLARALAWARIGLGASAVLAPTLAGRAWVGPSEADRPGARVLARALGGRDLALGLGVVQAMRHAAPVRGWVEAGGLADAGDLAATLVAWRHLPPRWRVGIGLITAGAVAAARLAAPGVDR
ncbi:MAG: hypothetical protein ACYDAD_14180 [Acidimicrobiales bacterium]